MALLHARLRSGGVLRPHHAPTGSPAPRWHARPRTVAAAAADEAAADAYAGDFYTLLGLSPRATPQEIRKAYKQMMREFHPDVVASTLGPEAHDDAHQLASLLNQIYETLADPEAREVYDMLAGFAEDEKTPNPFLDTSFPRDQVFVDELTCIGCGKCVRWCPATFEIEASKYGRARTICQPGDAHATESFDDVQISIEVCPVSCIHWVTLPQVSLLEAALATLPRVEVFVLQRSGNRSIANVFEVAYKAFERRRLKASEKARAAAAGGKADKFRYVEWTFWNQPDPAATQQEGDGASSHQGAGTTQQRRVAGLAAAAARTLRVWHSKGGRVRPIKGLLAG